MGNEGGEHRDQGWDSSRGGGAGEVREMLERKMGDEEGGGELR